MAVQLVDWKEIEELYPMGKMITSKVSEHRHFGVFVDIRHNIALGHVPVPDFLDTDGPKFPSVILPYPLVSSEINAIVIDYARNERQQVWLSMNPTRLKEVSPYLSE